MTTASSTTCSRLGPAPARPVNELLQTGNEDAGIDLVDPGAWNRDRHGVVPIPRNRRAGASGISSRRPRGRRIGASPQGGSGLERLERLQTYSAVKRADATAGLKAWKAYRDWVVGDALKSSEPRSSRKPRFWETSA
jgi:hypothetical protein